MGRNEREQGFLGSQRERELRRRVNQCQISQVRSERLSLASESARPPAAFAGAARVTAGRGSSCQGRRANGEAVSSGHATLCEAGRGGADGLGRARGKRGSALSAGKPRAQAQGAEPASATSIGCHLTLDISRPETRPRPREAQVSRPKAFAFFMFHPESTVSFSYEKAGNGKFPGAAQGWAQRRSRSVTSRSVTSRSVTSRSVTSRSVTS